MLYHWGFRTYRQHLEARFPGQRLRKLCLQAGLSCPNLDGTVARGGCAFCDNTAFAPGVQAGGDLRQQWDRGRLALRRRHRLVDGFIGYFQSFTNTHATVTRLQQLYGEIAAQLPECCGLSIGTRPDALPEAVVAFLEQLAQRTFLTVEIGLQSDRDSVLQALNRGHDVACFLDAMKRTNERGFERCVHVILGLPGEGPDAPERLGDLLAGLAIESVKIHNLHAVRGTAWGRAFTSGALVMPTRTQHVEAVARLLRRLRSDQAVQRVVADAPDKLLLSGRWCQDKQDFLARLRYHVHRDTASPKTQSLT